MVDDDEEVVVSLVFLGAMSGLLAMSEYNA